MDLDVTEPMGMETFVRAMLLSRGDPWVFLERPLSLTFLILSGLVLLFLALPTIKKAREEAFQE